MEDFFAEDFFAPLFFAGLFFAEDFLALDFFAGDFLDLLAFDAAFFAGMMILLFKGRLGSRTF
ncbi:MAG TPA: hypothetical protein VNM92_00055 [Thermoanaerobaculia bacterium]|nr:hypothetical protein [Thermoanaerobaculia bacterium]